MKIVKYIITFLVLKVALRNFVKIKICTDGTNWSLPAKCSLGNNCTKLLLIACFWINQFHLNPSKLFVTCKMMGSHT